ncbi:hypothetical protein AAZX31_13G275300 [Glycine max]
MEKQRTGISRPTYINVSLTAEQNIVFMLCDCY